MLYDRTLIQIRERSFLDLLDLSLYVVRARPLVLALAALAGIAPWAILDYWLLADPAFSKLVWMLLLTLEAPWATAPLTLVLGDLMFGLRPRPARMLLTIMTGLPALILGQLIVRGLLLVSVAFYAFMPSQYSYLNEVVLLERLGAFKQFKRARTLSRGFGGEFFLRWLGQILLGATFALCFWSSARGWSAMLIKSELTWYNPGMADLSGVLFQTGVWIAIAFFGVYRFFSYIDRRIRLEGWELDLRLKAVARGMEAKTD
jgi:hypothetical protein